MADPKRDYDGRNAASTYQAKLQNATYSALGTVQHTANVAASRGRATVDSYLPPEKREDLIKRLQFFIRAHPKLSAFLATNIIFTGIPLAIMLLFSISVFTTSLVVALIVAVSSAVGIALFSIGCAMLLFLPTIFFTTIAACFVFAWGLGIYLILSWLNTKKDATQSSTSRDDSLHSETRRKLDKAWNANIDSSSDLTTPLQGDSGATPNGTSPSV